MLRYVEKIQDKPEHIRRMILFVSVGLIMIIIVTVWLSTFSMRFSSKSGNEKESLKTISPFSVVGSNTADFYDNLKNKISDIKVQFNNK